MMQGTFFMGRNNEANNSSDTLGKDMALVPKRNANYMRTFYDHSDFGHVVHDTCVAVYHV